MVEVSLFTYANEVYTVYTVQGKNRASPHDPLFTDATHMATGRENRGVLRGWAFVHVQTLPFFVAVGKRICLAASIRNGDTPHLPEGRAPIGCSGARTFGGEFEGLDQESGGTDFGRNHDRHFCNSLGAGTS